MEILGRKFVWKKMVEKLGGNVTRINLLGNCVYKMVGKMIGKYRLNSRVTKLKENFVEK